MTKWMWRVSGEVVDKWRSGYLVEKWWISVEVVTKWRSGD